MRLDRSLFTPIAGKKVAIVGFAESYKLAPVDDPTVEIVGLNELWKYLPRWDRWWEVHDAATLGVTIRDLSEGEQKRHLAWLAQNHGPNKPIFMQPQFCDGRFPNAVPAPIDELCAAFLRYFTSSIGYMIAYEMLHGASWIGLYGIDLASDIEYQQQRANAEWLVGIAMGLGIEIELAPTSAICKGGHLYGIENPVGDTRMTALVKTHLAGLRKKHDETLAMLNTLDGAIQESENFLKLPEFLERGVHLTSY